MQHATDEAGRAPGLVTLPLIVATGIATMADLGYLTTAQAAQLLGMTVRSVNRLIRTGAIKAQMFGKEHLYLIEQAEVERYQRERKGRGRPRKQEE